MKVYISNREKYLKYLTKKKKKKKELKDSLTTNFLIMVIYLLKLNLLKEYYQNLNKNSVSSLKYCAVQKYKAS